MKRIEINQVADLINNKFEKDRKKIRKAIDVIGSGDYRQAELILMKMLCNYKIVKITLVENNNE